MKGTGRQLETTAWVTWLLAESWVAGDSRVTGDKSGPGDSCSCSPTGQHVNNMILVAFFNPSPCVQPYPSVTTNPALCVTCFAVFSFDSTS